MVWDGNGVDLFDWDGTELKIQPPWSENISLALHQVYPYDPGIPPSSLFVINVPGGFVMWHGSALGWGKVWAFLTFSAWSESPRGSIFEDYILLFRPKRRGLGLAQWSGNERTRNVLSCQNFQYVDDTVNDTVSLEGSRVKGRTVEAWRTLNFRFLLQFNTNQSLLISVAQEQVCQVGTSWKCALWSWKYDGVLLRCFVASIRLYSTTHCWQYVFTLPWESHCQSLWADTPAQLGYLSINRSVAQSPKVPLQHLKWNYYG